MNKINVIVSVSLFVAVPLGAFLGYALYTYLRSKPLNAVLWWQDNWLGLIAASIVAALVANLLAGKLHR